ncbi:MAG TPA: YceD family protein [Sporichthya sp.]|nr:YceD family protein [Sporichthya sp.]
MPEETQKPQRLDPSDPLVIDVHRLARRPGSMLREVRTVPAPADLGLDVIGVPEGADLELNLKLEAVMEGVLVSGTARAPLAGECVRCLDPLDDTIEVEFAELFVSPGRPGDTAGQDDGDDETCWLQDDLVELEPVVRDAVVLALPLQPMCEDDCPGLCSQCGARLADDPGHRHDSVDPRWAALEAIARPDVQPGEK